MRRLPTRLALALLLSASGGCSIAHLAHLPSSGGEIRVRTRPGGHYIRTGTDGTGFLRLLECEQPATDQRADAYAQPGRRTVARNSGGDALEIAADAVPPGTHLKIVRHRGRPFRWVTVGSSKSAPSRLTIDTRGCTVMPNLTVVRWTGRGWEDAGADEVPGDSAATTSLPHHSIYAVAGS